MRRAVLLAIAAVLALAPAAQARTLVRYSAVGGIAGTNHRLTVGSAGAAVVRDNGRPARHFRLTDRQLRGLRHALRAAHFSTLEHRYAPAYPVLDGIWERVSYRGRTVSVETGADPPKRLQDLLNRLSRLG